MVVARVLASPTYQHPPGPVHRRPWGILNNPAVAAEIASLDAQRDCQRIVYLLASHEFPFDLYRSLELALFHTYGARRVALLLDATKEFERRGQRRYDDTNILIGQFIEAGWDNERGSEAIKRMNAIHSRFNIPNEDFLFVLWTFIDFPIDWMQRYGWRRFTAHEERAWFNYWHRIGVLMGLENIPNTRADFDRFVDAYEAEHMVPTDACRRVVDATIDIMRAWFPAPVRPLVMVAVRSLARPRLLAAAGYTRAPAFVRSLIDLALRTRGVVKRVFPLEGYAKPNGADGYRSYPDGAPALADVGPGRATAD